MAGGSSPWVVPSFCSRSQTRWLVIKIRSTWPGLLPFLMSSASYYSGQYGFPSEASAELGQHPTSNTAHRVTGPGSSLRLRGPVAPPSGESEGLGARRRGGCLRWSRFRLGAPSSGKFRPASSYYRFKRVGCSDLGAPGGSVSGSACQLATASGRSARTLPSTLPSSSGCSTYQHPP